ncbi:hypothetical protein SBRY_10152 [Actinacidiphila bryophytorum]|uniref:Uncharacterized protein n=1 Tax=Actinacidiphila bryophytorum TaxID=1436133 RepID=A0A9W4DZY1_9ACTN|nr:hypothetical protein SBRY_10152 [Actinacidiphila bryophytorum]
MRALSTSCRSTFETMSKLESAIFSGLLDCVPSAFHRSIFPTARRRPVTHHPSHRTPLSALINPVANHPRASGIVYVVATDHRPQRTLPGASSHGGMPEWPMGADCKSVGLAYRGSNPRAATWKRSPTCIDAGRGPLF